MRVATGGETIVIAGGAYGTLTLSKFNFAEQFTIASGNEMDNVLRGSAGRNRFDGVPVQIRDGVDHTIDLETVHGAVHPTVLASG